MREMGAKKYIIEVNGNEYEVLIKDKVDSEGSNFSSETLKSENDPDANQSFNISKIKNESISEEKKNNKTEELKKEEFENIEAPMAGNITSVNCESGDFVKKGDVIFNLEAMKMETKVSAPMSGNIRKVLISEGESCERGTILALIQEEE